MTEIINYYVETESGLSKQLLGNFQNEYLFTGKYLCQSLFFSKKEALAQVFSCEFCKFFKKPFLQNTSGRLLLKNGIACKKNVYYNDGINKVYLLAPRWNHYDGTIIGTIF